MKNKFLIVASAIFLILFPSIACQVTTQELNQQPQPQQPQQSQEAPFKRTLTTPAYNGEPAIIFRMDDVAKGQNEEVVEAIIRLFGENNVPLDVGIVPHNDGRDSYDIPFLKLYLDAGIIDISMHGNQHFSMEFDTAKAGTSYEKLKSDLILARQQLQQYFSVTPLAFLVPYDYFSEDGYKAIQDAGFKIFSTQKAVEPHPSIQPVDYSGDLNENGMSRLCTVDDVARWDANKQEWGDIFSADPNSELFYGIDWGINNLGVAVVGIHPQAFVGGTNKIDTGKLSKLDAIIKLSKKRGTITTFESWYKYVNVVVVGPPHQRKLKTPAYNGGPAIIFRMDDVQKGVNEEPVERIIKLFQQNNIPLDVGVMPFAGGGNSYDIPFLLKYLDAGVIDITVHGYRNTFAEFSTEISGATYDKLDENLKKCFEDAYGKVTYIPQKTSYEELKLGLVKARAHFKHYFGVEPVTFSAPNEFYDEDGYRAVQDAGFKIFSSGMEIDLAPWVAEPLDYLGRKDKNGMYHIPAIASVAEWDSTKCKWGNILPLNNPIDILAFSIEEALKGELRVAVLVIHPQIFVDARNKVDEEKLKKLDVIVKYVIDHRDKYGMVTTFQSWYDYISNRQPE